MKNPPRGRVGAKMQVRWMLFQAAVATPVFYFCAVTLNGQGLAPAIVAMIAALLATVLLSSILNGLRRLRVGNKTNGEVSRPPPIPWSSSDSPQQVRRIWVSQDRRKLP